jgi:hypothetical protein
MPNTGDYIKKEREGLDLIIKMHKQNERKAVPIGELLVFIVLPLALAAGIWKQKELTEFARSNEQVCSMIKVVYPAWKSAAELAPPPLPMDQAGVTSEPGQPLPPGSAPTDGTVPAASTTTSPEQPVSAPAQPAAAPAPEVQGPAERGSLLH